MRYRCASSSRTCCGHFAPSGRSRPFLCRARANAVVLRLVLVVLAALMGAMAAFAGTSETWKRQIAYPDDPFLSPRVTFQLDEVRWIKFTIRKQAPDTVYFQDSRSYLFHYDFVSEQLDSYLGISRAAFDGITLHADGQELVLGVEGQDGHPPILPGRVVHQSIR